MKNIALKHMGLKVGQTLTLLELDELADKFINNNDIETPLESYGAEEVLEWGKYIFYTEEGSDYYYRIYFNIIKNTGDEDSVIEIIKEE